MAPAIPPRTANLALLFQELFTAAERLRSNRQVVSDAESFRHHIHEAVKTAAQESRDRAGYSTDDIRLATLAVVGFLDETILNLQNPVFANWLRKPLQEELFGTHMAGEVFFQNLQMLLGRTDSADLGDVLEVYYLCLLLGYGGRYSLGNRGDLQAIMHSTAQKLQRIRGSFPGLSPAWAPSVEGVAPARNPWSRRILIGAIACFALALVLFVVFKILLSSGASGFERIVS
jgi:type VI secretion system protein ImpK